MPDIGARAYYYSRTLFCSGGQRIDSEKKDWNIIYCTSHTGIPSYISTFCFSCLLTSRRQPITRHKTAPPPCPSVVDGKDPSSDETTVVVVVVVVVVSLGKYGRHIQRKHAFAA